MPCAAQPNRVACSAKFAHAAPVYSTVEELRDRLAVPIPNEQTDRYHKKAKERGVYIQTGTFLEVDRKWPGVVFNTTCLIGPDGLLSRYRKVYPWLPWEVHASPHDLAGYDEPMFPVVETEIGRLGAAVCTICAQLTHASFGRTIRLTLNCSGMRSRIS